MRLFIAINFNNDTRARLLSLRDDLREQSERGNFSHPENLHLTLAFLGECEQRDAAPNGRLRRVLESVIFEPFEVTIDRVGRFKRDGGKQRVPAKSQDFVGKGAMTERVSFSPSGGNEQAKSIATWWAGGQESKPLLKLQRDLNDKLVAAGFNLESRKYSPHITLGREVMTDVKPWPIEPFGETVRQIDLMKSERIQGKLTYTAIYHKTGI